MNDNNHCKTLNLTNIKHNNILFMQFIHIKMGCNPHICWFVKKNWGQMEETKIDQF